MLGSFLIKVSIGNGLGTFIIFICDGGFMLMLVGAGIMLPIILAYTVYVYSLFWGKVDPDEAYHD